MDGERQLSLVIVVLLVVVLVIQFMQFREGGQYREHSLAEMRAISQRVTVLENELEHVRASLDKLERHTIGAVVKDANNTLVTGWSAFMQAMEREVERAAEVIDREFGKPAKENETPEKPAR